MSFLIRLRDAAGRLRVGQQLYGAFAVLIALTAAIGGLALYGLARSDAEAGVLAGKWLQGVGHLAVARSAVLESRDFEIKHSRVEDRTYHAEYEEKVSLAVKAASSAMAATSVLL